MLLSVAILLVLLWGGVVLMLWQQQERLIFPGWGFQTVVASGLGPAGERVTLEREDGVTLVGGLIRARAPTRGLLLVFTGNAEDTDWRLRQVGVAFPDFDVAGFFYRGFGPSEGRPSQAALVADAVAIHDRLVAELQPPRVLAAGFSIGTGVAAQLARERPLHGALLVTPFDSLVAVAAQLHPYAPVRPLLRHPFDSAGALALLDLPVAVIGARQDQVIPIARTQKLIEALRRPVLIEWVEDADHVSIYSHAGYPALFRSAMEALLEAAG